jgi:Ner family transcriptional regulator
MSAVSKKAWTAEDIKAAIYKQGMTLSQLAAAHNFDRQSVGTALTIRRPNVQFIISRFIDVPMHELWPEWYAPGGRPMFRFRRDLLLPEYRAQIEKNTQVAA